MHIFVSFYNMSRSVTAIWETALVAPDLKELERDL